LHGVHRRKGWSFCYYRRKCCESLIFWKVIRGCVTGLNTQASQQALPHALSEELRTLLISSTHRITKVREMASKYLNRLITSFPSLMCDPPLVFAILEVLTLLRRACENEFMDEVLFSPIISTLFLTDMSVAV
jgi:phosphatidylinositol 4-kinase